LAGICILDSSTSTSTFGRGSLSRYVITSNTHAGNFVSSVLHDNPLSSPPEIVTGTILEPLRDSKVAKGLLEINEGVAPLRAIGGWLGAVGGRFWGDLNRKERGGVCQARSGEKVLKASYVEVFCGAADSGERAKPSQAKRSQAKRSQAN